jgi:hypothetical protein
MFNSFISKFFVFLFFIISISISGQSKSRSFFIETNIIPEGDKYICYVSYRIPYRNLVFVKGPQGYKTGMDFSVEVFKEEELIVRESSSESFSIKDYEKTESTKYFLEGILSLSIDKGEYSFNPIINLSNTNRTIKLRSYNR